MAPLSIQLQNDNWTLSFACDAYSRGETDALLLPKASESWVLATPRRLLHDPGDERRHHGGPGHRGPLPVSERGPGAGAHRRGPGALRRQQPGRQQDHHGPARLLHASGDRPGHRRRRVGRLRGFVGLLHLCPNAELRGQRAPLFLPQDRAGLAAHGNVQSVLDVGAHPNGDRRRRRRRGLPNPGGTPTCATSCGLPARRAVRCSTSSKSSSRLAS